MSATVDVIEWGAERARASQWRGHADVAYLMPLPGAPSPSAGFVRRCCDDLAARGYAEVVTGALAPAEQRGFAAAGFEVREHLVLLAHDLLDLPTPTEPAGAGWDLRRARRRDRPDVLAVDGRAFRTFWRLDDTGLDEAIDATPSTRFRVATSTADGHIVGYAVSGRAGRRGYLQRLAVDPDDQRGGVGRRLSLDALHWMHRRGVDRAVVNTQPDNHAALVLYEAIGFRRQATGLDVLGRRL